MNRDGATTRLDELGADIEALATGILDAAFTVHRGLGPGLLESVYEACLCHELTKRSIPFARQTSLPIRYDGQIIEAGLRLDLIVDQKVVIEMKAVERLAPIHTAQVLTYLKLTGCQLGLLINFNTELLKQGIKRVVLSRPQLPGDKVFSRPRRRDDAMDGET